MLIFVEFISGLKHHTSKLRDFSDIFEVSTFGFRGEALSSLCSLSDVTITTKHINSEHAFKLYFDKNGLLKKKDICAREPGTTVSVKNIFKNLPVRAKEFQRNIKKEFSKAVQVLYGYCLISTGIKITCTNTIEGKSTNQIVGTNGSSNILDNTASVFGKKSLTGIEEIIICQPDDDIKEEFNLTREITGDFTWNFYSSSCEHGMGRASPDRQFFFVNGRPCTLVKINKLINSIYHKFNNKQYPFIFLNLKLNQNTADVNVTPDKRTVFLTEEKLVLATVKTSLQKKWEKMQGNFRSQTLEQLQNSLKRNLTSPSRDSTPPQKKKMFQLSQPVDEESEEIIEPVLKIKNKEKNVIVDKEIEPVILEKLPDAEMKINLESIRRAMEKKLRLKNENKTNEIKIKYRAEIDPTKSADAEKELMKELTKESFIKVI